MVINIFDFKNKSRSKPRRVSLDTQVIDLAMSAAAGYTVHRVTRAAAHPSDAPALNSGLYEEQRRSQLQHAENVRDACKKEYAAFGFGFPAVDPREWCEAIGITYVAVVPCQACGAALKRRVPFVSPNGIYGGLVGLPCRCDPTTINAVYHELPEELQNASRSYGAGE